MRDFKAQPTYTALSGFCELYNLKNIVQDKTCFRNPNKPNCIDLIITNQIQFVTLMRMSCSKQKPTIIHYRKYNDFDDNFFITYLNTLLRKVVKWSDTL